MSSTAFPIKQIVDWRDQGQTWKWIAQQLNVNPGTLRRWAQVHGIAVNKHLHPLPIFTHQRIEKLQINDLLELVRANQAANDRADPILTHAKIQIPSSTPIGIIFTSCAHLGSRYVNHTKFKMLLERALQIPGLYWISLGDDTEGFINFHDAAASHEQALANPKLQRQLLARVLEKLAASNKLLAGFSSQHGSQWLERKVAEDPIKALYLEHQVPYFDGQAYIRVAVGMKEPIVYRLFGGHQLPGHSIYNPVHSQRRAGLFKAPSADVLFQGDKHQYSVQEVALDTFEILAGERQSNRLWLVQVGTAKTGPDKYTIRTWSPGEWGWPILIFRHDRHQIVSVSDLDLAEMILGEWA